MREDRIEAALQRITVAAGRIDTAAAKLQDAPGSAASSDNSTISRSAVATALAELDSLLEALQR